MKFVRILALAFVTTLAVPASAEWTKTESHEYSAKTSLKITEPANAPNAKVTVTIGNETKEESLPAIFSLPDTDAYIPVKVVAADGDVWTGKVEVKAHKQTVLQLTHVAKGAPAAAAPGHKYIGRFENATNLCSANDRVDKFVAMRDGKVAYESPIGPNKVQHNIELEAGTYTIRIFRGGIFVKALDLNVTKDGWVFRYGC
ncbi:MAG: hypothetical protein HOO96_14175 [Polyangiaceae bacterium]|nr:hypothetical protein [Polyangiaceae bacterium]